MRYKSFRCFSVDGIYSLSWQPAADTVFCSLEVFAELPAICDNTVFL